VIESGPIQVAEFLHTGKTRSGLTARSEVGS